MKTNQNIRSLFLLDNNITFLNHGSYGACPRPIFDDLQSWQLLLENQPVDFLANKVEERMERSRLALSGLVHCSKDDLVFFPNPTTAMNEVIRSLDLGPNDEILSTDHEYGAIDKTWGFICNKVGSLYRKQPISLPIQSEDLFIEQFFSGMTKRTKAVFISHITSSTGLIFPVEEVCRIAKENNLITIVDGAHVPGHIDLDLNEIDADIYVGACHKWLLCPKGVSFLYVTSELQHMIKPLIISWGYDSDDYHHTPFQNHHIWQGTQDISNYLTIPSALKFREDYDWEAVTDISKDIILEFNKQVHQLLNVDPIVMDDPKKWLGQMCTFPFNMELNDIDKMQCKLRDHYQIEIPVINWNNKVYLRISINGYNDWNDIEKLFDYLKKEMNY